MQVVMKRAVFVQNVADHKLAKDTHSRGCCRWAWTNSLWQRFCKLVFLCWRMIKFFGTYSICLRKKWWWCDGSPGCCWLKLKCHFSRRKHVFKTEHVAAAELEVLLITILVTVDTDYFNCFTPRVFYYKKCIASSFGLSHPLNKH